MDGRKPEKTGKGRMNMGPGEKNVSADHWRYLLMRINLGVLFLMPLVELSMYPYLDFAGLIHCTFQKYLLVYVLLPFFINLPIVVLGYRLLRCSRLGPEQKDAIPIVGLSLICFCILCIHSIFVVSLCMFTVPVVISGLFGRKKLTNWIALLNVVLLCAAVLLPKYDDAFRDGLYAGNFLLSLLVFAVTYFLTRVLISHNHFREESLRRSHQEQSRLRQDLLRDGLTGVYNRMGYEKFLTEEKERFERGEISFFSLAMVDIDNFKSVNDQYGHMNGDVVLKCLTQMLQEGTQGKDAKVCRYGGEEFVILFSDMDLKEIYALMEELRKQFEAFQYDFSAGGRITFSCGIKGCRKGTDRESLFRLADEALYEVKNGGKNQVRLSR